MPIALSRVRVGSTLLTVLFTGALTLAAAGPAGANAKGNTPAGNAGPTTGNTSRRAETHGFSYSSVTSKSDDKARAHSSAPPATGRQVSTPARNGSNCASGIYSLPRESAAYSSKKVRHFGHCGNREATN